LFDISRSEIEAITDCEERAYAAYREDGHGYSPSGWQENIPTLQGIALHDGGQEIFTNGLGGNWRELLEARLYFLPEPHRTIRTTLMRRALLGWTIKRYPQIIQEWKPLAAELPFKWELSPGFRQPLRMDDIMEHRDHGGLAIFDFKTSGGPDLNWTARKKISKQTHLYIKALQEVAPDRFVSGMMYDCINIGKWDNKLNVHKSPLVTGYQKNAKIKAKWVYGADRVDLCGWSDDDWLKWILEEKALDDLYWTTGLILPSPEDLERTKQSTITQIQDWSIKLNRVKNSPDPRSEANKLFIRNPEACLQYGWDHACEFYNRCWKGHRIDPETFSPRLDHHKSDAK
jgi:hypothetical protein